MANLLLIIFELEHWDVVIDVQNVNRHLEWTGKEARISGAAHHDYVGDDDGDGDGGDVVDDDYHDVMMIMLITIMVAMVAM